MLVPGRAQLAGLAVQGLEGAGGGLYLIHKLAVTLSGCA